MQLDHWLAIYFGATSLLGAGMAGWEIHSYTQADRDKYSIAALAAGTLFGCLFAIPMLAAWTGYWLRSKVTGSKGK